MILTQLRIDPLTPTQATKPLAMPCSEVPLQSPHSSKEIVLVFDLHPSPTAMGTGLET